MNFVVSGCKVTGHALPPRSVNRMIRNRSCTAALVGALFFGLTGCGSGDDEESDAQVTTTSTEAAAPTTAVLDKVLVAAKRDCVPGSPHAELGDGGSSIVLDGFGDEDLPSQGLSFEDTICFLDAVDMPDHVRSALRETRALDGVQEADWAGWHARWTYHPDEGLDIILNEEKTP